MKKLLAIVLLCWTQLAHAMVSDELIMIRSTLAFPEAMTALQHAITDHGYTISRVQRIDIGLTSSGYKTDKYRVVFFGKINEIHKLRDEFPELIPYLPLKIAIFAEGEETILVISNPIAFTQLYPDAELKKVFLRWQQDIVAIFNSVQIAE
ncbi:MAG TPA: DUF302 domain-containing protein [Gammaproteobacteria bacterium]